MTRSADAVGRRVLVLDASARSALAACRALGRAGFDVTAGGYRAGELAGYSRYCRRYRVLPDPRHAGSAFSDALAAVVARDGYDAVIATDDATLARLQWLGPAFPTVPRTGDALAALTDKLRLMQLGAGTGVPYPRTLALDGAHTVGVAADELGLPLVVKASRSAQATAAAVGHHPGAAIARDENAASRAEATIRAAGLEPIAQAYVRRGVKIDVVLFRRSGTSDVRLAYHVRRDVPLTGGLAVTAETVSSVHGPGAAALDSLELLCDAAGYEGLANGEFCLSADDDRLYLIEVNPRLWASAWFGERLRQRIAERCVRHALGMAALPPVSYPIGRRYHDLVGELRWALLHERRRGPLLDLVRSTRPWDVFEYDDLSDPAPLVRHAIARLVGRRATR